MDNHFAAEPKRMFITYIKLLVRPRTGETSKDSELSVLHNLVCLKDAGGAGKEATNLHAWETLLAFSKLIEKYRPIAIDTVTIRL